MLRCFSSAQLCATLWTVACQAPQFSRRILQARILEWVAIAFSRRSSNPAMKPTCLLSLLHWQAGSLPLA